MCILALGEPEATPTPTRKVRTTQRAEAFGCKKNPLGDLVVLAAGVLVWAVSADLASEYSVALFKHIYIYTHTYMYIYIFYIGAAGEDPPRG